MDLLQGQLLDVAQRPDTLWQGLFAVVEVGLSAPGRIHQPNQGMCVAPGCQNVQLERQRECGEQFCVGLGFGDGDGLEWVRGGPLESLIELRNRGAGHPERLFKVL